MMHSIDIRNREAAQELLDAIDLLSEASEGNVTLSRCADVANRAFCSYANLLAPKPGHDLWGIIYGGFRNLVLGVKLRPDLVQYSVQESLRELPEVMVLHLMRTHPDLSSWDDAATLVAMMQPTIN